MAALRSGGSRCAEWAGCVALRALLCGLALAWAGFALAQDGGGEVFRPKSADDTFSFFGDLLEEDAAAANSEDRPRYRSMGDSDPPAAPAHGPRYREIILPGDVVAHEAEPGTPKSAQPEPVVQGTDPDRVAAFSLLFELDSTRLKPQSLPELDMVGEALSREALADGRFYVNGHASNDGSEAHNYELSRNRALAVRDLLVSRHGISPERLEARGFGEWVPLVSNATTEGRELNRRVELELKH